MASKQSSPKQAPRRRPPATTPEARENQMIALAVDAAEKQIRDGTASSQIITHYLKLAGRKEAIEREILEANRDLLVAKTEQLQSAARQEELFEKAIAAMRMYQGQEVDESVD